MKNIFLNLLNLKLFFLFVSCSFIHNISLGQSAPTLGTATSFALFTAGGAFDNIGAATYVTGDVGTNVGAFTAFPPGTVVGQKHVADPASVTAATDVDVAYSYLSGLTCGVVISTTLGNNQVLGPNVYCLDAASTLNGSLILDGQGHSNALFIFKINGALSTSTFSNVILINSASLCNVYWQINGKFILGDSSVFRGTIVANGAINLLEGSTLLGRGLSRAGAISLHNNKVAIGMQPTATITAGSNTTFCSGNSVTLTATVTNGVGPFSYLWSPGGQTNSSITVSPMVSTSYIVAVMAMNGCSEGMDTLVVTVNSSATVNAGADKIVCDGSSVSLSGTNGGSSTSATWSGGSGSFSPGNFPSTTYTPTATEITAGSVTLTLTTNAPAGSCSAVSDAMTITFNTSATANAGADKTICAGSSVSLSGSIGGSAIGGIWSGGTGTFSPNNTTLNAVYTPSNADITAASVVLTLTGSCSQMTDQMTIKINPSPVVNLGPDTHICGCILLYAGNASSSFTWSTGDDYSTINVCTGGKYWVTVSNGICITSDTINITKNTSPLVNLGKDTTLPISGSVILNAGNTGDTFTWSTGVTTQKVTINTSGTYFVKVTNALGCSGSDTIHITILTGINDISSKQNFKIYPNPNNGTIQLDYFIAEEEQGEFSIYDINGRKVLKNMLKGGYNQITISSDNLDNGIYFYQIIANNKAIARNKLIIIK